MNPFVLPFINGNVFFYGLIISFSAFILGIFINGNRWWRFFLKVAIISSVVLVVLSATPAPMWVYAFWLVLLLMAQIFSDFDSKKKRPKKHACFLISLLACYSIFMFWSEMSYHMKPKISIANCSQLFVIGDSLGIGADTQEQNWPEILGKGLNLAVNNYSFGGAKVNTALSNAKRINAEKVLVILEVGGNDILSRTEIESYESGLEQMLQIVCGSGRRVVMLELPLPPFHNKYGEVQRRLSHRYGVSLIPKGYFAKVICTPDTTVDGLHLSHKGHELMATTMLKCFESNE